MNDDQKDSGAGLIYQVARPLAETEPRPIWDCRVCGFGVREGAALVWIRDHGDHYTARSERGPNNGTAFCPTCPDETLRCPPAPPLITLDGALCSLSLRVGLHVDLQVMDVVTGYQASLCDDSGKPIAQADGKTIQGALVALAQVGSVSVPQQEHTASTRRSAAQES